MIAATELRIGNWVVHSGGQQVRVVDIQFNKNHDGINSQSSVHFTPIPIDHDILLSCGFKNKGGWVGKSFLIDIWDETVELIFEFIDNNLTVFAADQRVRKLEKPTLHQLQNLYFSLTNSELEYSPKKINHEL